MPIYRTAVRHDYAIPGGPGFNVWHFRSPQVETEPGGVLTAAGIALSAFYDGLAGLFPPGSRISWDGLWSGVDTDEYRPPSGAWSVTGVAQGAQGYLPAASAVCVSWRSSVNTGSGRGRTFLSPLDASIRDASGTPGAAALTTIRTECQQLVDAFGGEGPDIGGAFGVYSRQENVIRDFVGFSVRDQFAVLRSRRD